jgi:hypothetical protein
MNWTAFKNFVSKQKFSLAFAKEMLLITRELPIFMGKFLRFQKLKSPNFVVEARVRNDVSWLVQTFNSLDPVLAK